MSHWHDDPELWKELLPVLTSPQMIEAAHNEARQVVELLALPEQARILDLGCGPGRHSLALARLGHRVTGVDATGPYLELARSRAMEEGLTIDFVHDSMLNFRREAAFDGITCLFTSFGYFESREDDQRVLNNMFANLRPCGRAVIDVFGKETMARIYTPRRWQEVGNGRYWLTDSDVESAWEKVRNKWVFVGGGETREFQFSHRIYSGGELDIMMRAAGFADVRILGGLDGAPYDRNAVRLVAIGTK